MAEKQRDAEVQKIIDLINNFYKGDEYTIGSKAWFKRRINSEKDDEELKKIKSELIDKEKEVKEAINKIMQKDGEKISEISREVALAAVKKLDRSIRGKENDEKKLAEDTENFKKLETILKKDRERTIDLKKRGGENNPIENRILELAKRKAMLECKKEYISLLDEINIKKKSMREQSDIDKDKKEIEGTQQKIKAIREQIKKNEEDKKNLSRELSVNEYERKSQELDDDTQAKKKDIEGLEQQINPIKKRVETDIMRKEDMNNLESKRKDLEAKMKQYGIKKAKSKDSIEMLENSYKRTKEEIMDRCARTFSQELLGKENVEKLDDLSDEDKNILDEEIESWVKHLYKNITITLPGKKGPITDWAKSILGKNESDVSAPYSRAVHSISKQRKNIQKGIEQDEKVLKKALAEEHIAGAFVPKSETLKEMMGVTKGEAQQGNEENTGSNPAQQSAGENTGSNPAQQSAGENTTGSDPTQPSDAAQQSAGENTTGSDPAQPGDVAKAETLEIEQDENIKECAEDLAKLVKARTALTKKLGWWQIFKKLARIPAKHKYSSKKMVTVRGKFREALKSALAKSGIDVNNIPEKNLDECAGKIVNGTWKLEIPSEIATAVEQNNPPTSEQNNPPITKQSNPPTAEQSNPPTTEQSNPPVAQAKKPKQVKSHSAEYYKYDKAFEAIAEVWLDNQRNSSGSTGNLKSKGQDQDEKSK